MISYAQNYEDVVLARVFHNQSTGYYIDVGAWDPTIESVTKHFYDRGWRGINIEPIPTQHALFVRDRPEDINLCTLVGAEPGFVPFHVWHGTGLSAIHEHFEPSRLEASGYRRETTVAPMMTLKDITTIHCSNKVIDFLKIDVEGYERHVLEGIDWNTCRPRVILLEAIQPILPGQDATDYVATWDEWEHLLLSHRYEFALFDGLNRFYFRSEEQHLRRRLEVPANVRDAFTPARFATRAA
jgi:FkbM family methyltransferase